MVHRSSFIVHRSVLAVLSGVLFAISFPNYSIAWLIFIAPIPLLLALTKSRGGWESFFLGWLSQFVAWLMMVPWIVRGMSHYGGLPYVTAVLLLIPLCVILGLYGRLVRVRFRRVAPRVG